MARRARIPFFTMVGLLIIFGFLLLLRYRNQDHQALLTFASSHRDAAKDLDPNILHGHVISEKLDNQTVKAEVGRSAWKLLHTMMAKFPDKPTSEESQALESFIHLFARLYPCGECATHFQEIITQFPPQVATRSTAAVWACHVHNQVNKSLKKELFDCSKIGDFYDCGCADDNSSASKLANSTNKAIQMKLKY
ncbi:FAD-linked sulfhydryl oxidase ERV2 [Erysiphe necator]|nr:FAD-linked sulfhydryl oxidase ERV2 [Erysiphe necator]